MSATNKKLLFLIFSGLILYGIFIASHFDKLYLYEDSYGYFFPAAENHLGHGINLIYGRTIGYPVFLSAIMGPHFESFAVSWQSFMYVTSAFLIFLFAREVRFSKSRILSLIALVASLIVIAFYFANNTIFGFVGILMPETMSILCLSSSFVSLMFFLKDGKKIKYCIIAVVMASILYVTKPAFVIYSLLVLALCLYNVIKSENVLFKKIFIILLTFSIFLTFHQINHISVEKHDKLGSERFKYGTLICSNLNAIDHALDSKEINSILSLDVKSDLQLRVNKLIDDGPGTYSLLGFNIDTCIYDSNKHIYSYLDQKYGWGKSSYVLKELFDYSITHSSEYFFKKMLKQVSYQFMNPSRMNGNSQDIFFSDIRIKEMNRFHSNSYENYFFINHKWEKEVSVKNYFGGFGQMPGIIFLIILLISAICYWFDCGKNKPNFIYFSTPFALCLSSTLIIAFAGSFDISRYADNLLIIFMLSMIFYFNYFICIIESIIRKK